MTLKDSLIDYLGNSPLLFDKPHIDVASMPTDELLEFADAVVDETANAISSHSYDIIEVGDYAAAKKYEHYAPAWCIFQSEDVFYEETYQGTCHFVFCKRDDADLYNKVAFGEEYPYDNYGMSFFALLLTEGNRVVSVTSRRNWDDNYGNYLTNKQLKEILGENLYGKIINEKPLTILHISDTHNQHRSLVNLPEADIIVHSGDFCFAGTEDEAFDFMNWFCDLPYKHKVFVAGNHDDCMYGANIIEGLDANCHYLCNSSVIIERVKFYGIPLFMEDVSDGKTDRQIARIPHDTEVLITHNPPYNILDCSKNIHYGDWLLPEVIKQRDNLRVHLFGHIHDAAGTITQEGVVYSNASLVDENYNKQEQEYHVIQLKHPSQG